MRLTNTHGTIHHVHVQISTCDVYITREGRKLLKLQFDLSIGFVDGLNKIKRIVELDDEMYDFLAHSSSSQESQDQP